MPLKKDKKKPSVYSEAIITFKQILIGKLTFALTIIIFIWKVPSEHYVEFFGYTIIAMLIAGIIRRIGWTTQSFNNYLIIAITGYASAMWMLAVAQAITK